MSQRVRPQRVRANFNRHSIQRYINRKTRVKRKYCGEKVFGEKHKASEDHPRKKLKHKLSASK
nr:unnamed protein product [Callosobruchus chinensis]